MSAVLLLVLFNFGILCWFESWLYFILFGQITAHEFWFVRKNNGSKMWNKQFVQFNFVDLLSI